MDHQVQGLTLVNNEWVSRPLDIYQIMAQARKEDVEPRDNTAGPMAHVPKYGILSRTVFATPLIKHILPASIRQRQLTDIVLVGEDSVQLKQICDYGRLRHVATKTDFNGARIMVAKVFGQPHDSHNASSSDNPLSSLSTMHRPRRLVISNGELILPQQLVVLTLSTRTLMFLWARQHQDGIVTFSQKTVGLPAGNSRFDRLGAFLAVDAKCRAMAVAAQEGRLMLYKTKSMEDWRSTLRRGAECLPISDERIILFEGRVMHMEFLSSGNQLDEFHVVLLLIIVHQGRTKITCFDWDCRQDLDKATARAERVALDFEDRNPSLLVPMLQNTNFLLVSDTHISMYKDVLSGVPVRITIPISSKILLPLSPGDSRRRPQWTAWDKAPRNPNFPKDVFYIAREDGRMMYVSCGPGFYAEVSGVGNWPYSIDTAFACVNVDTSGLSQSFPDILVAGGAGNDASLCRVGAWPTEYSYSADYSGTNVVTFIEALSDWTPLTDLSIARLSGSRVAGERDRCAIFASNGNAPNGRISELRRGLHAQVDDSFSGVNGTTGLWVLDYGSHTINLEDKHHRQHYATFVLNWPPESLVVRVVRTQPENHEQYSGSWESGTWDKYQVPAIDEPVDDGLMRDGETLSACVWSERYSIQISKSEARILQRPTMRQQAALSFENPLLLANAKPGVPFVAVSYRQDGKTFIEIVHVTHTASFQRVDGCRVQSASDPTCLEILDIDGVASVFVSTFDSKIALLQVDMLGNISPLFDVTLENMVAHDERSLVESVVVLSTHEQNQLVCTTRDGWILSTPFSGESSASSKIRWTATRIGLTPARMTQSSTDASAAFVSCGADLCRVRHNPITQDLSIDSIWFTSHRAPEYTQSSITATCQLPSYTGSNSMERNIGGFLFAVAGEQLLFSQLDWDVGQIEAAQPGQNDADVKTVIRSISTGAKATILTYLKSQRRFLVATMEGKEERPPPDGTRVLQSTLKLLSTTNSKPLDEADIKQEDMVSPVDELLVAEYRLEHAERVYTMIDWHFDTHNGKRYSLLIVGTGIQGSGKSKGRRLIFSLGKSASKFSLQKESTYDSPVYCVATWGNGSIITSIGNIVSLDSYDSQAGRWKRLASIELPSAGIYVTAKPPFVYVSTLSHSHLCYEILKRDDGSHCIEQVFSDNRERSCTHHLVLNLPTTASTIETDTIVLFTDKKSASVAGLHQPPGRMCRTASATVFEASLPHTVVRLHRGDIRPPWRRPYTYKTANTTIPGILVDDIIGACTDGTIYSFSILSSPAQQLLRLLQNLLDAKRYRDVASQDSAIRPRSGRISDVLMNGAEGAQDGLIRAHDVDPRHHHQAYSGAKCKHVDGDALEKWSKEDGDLEGLVTIGTEKSVEVIFREMVQSVFAEWDEKHTEEVFAAVKKWIGDIVMPVL